jgi:5-hydroxyisourate hydrolase
MPPSISTHVLDTATGLPARGVRVELYRGSSLVSSQETDADGRIANLLQEALETGTYRLVFHPPSAFFNRIEIEFNITDAGRHYHIPLLVSPFGCTTYRGS